MRLLTLHLRSVQHHWRMHLAVMLGVAVGTAALTGALIVGDSMRSSLRNVALGRLGRVDHAMVSPQFFQQTLADDLIKIPEFSSRYAQACPLILLRGGAVHAERQTRVNHINVLGIDERFWHMGSQLIPPRSVSFPARSVLLNEPLAHDLGASVGDDIIVRMGKPSTVPTESLLGRRDDTTSSLRLRVSEILPAKDMGIFSLDHKHAQPRNAYIPLQTLQRTLDKKNRVNTLLVKNKIPSRNLPNSDDDPLQSILQKYATLDDLGLTLRKDDLRQYIAMESEQMLIDPVIESAAVATAKKLNIQSTPILTHLANTIAVENEQNDTKKNVVPYSTVAAIPSTGSLLSSMSFVDSESISSLQAGEILLNQWTANHLKAKPGDRIRLDYFVTESFGQLAEQSASFILRGVIQMNTFAADPGFIPAYPGVTDTENLSDWDAPFPVDFNRITDKDEAYWDQYKTTPKAFISLIEGQRLWATKGDQLGRVTSIRLTDERNELDVIAAEFEDEFFNHLLVEQMGMRFDPVRKNALAVSKGTTDFGGLFIGFSFFLIFSSAMLVSLLFRLGVERRTFEVGLLLATGFTRLRIARILLGEGAVVAVTGSIIGLFGAAVYAWLMLAGLRSWWSEAVNAPFLKLDITNTSLAMGFILSVMVAMMSVGWAIRGLTKCSPRELLAGIISMASSVKQSIQSKRDKMTAIVAFMVSLFLVSLAITTDTMPRAITFFFSGAIMLTGSLALIRHWLHRTPANIIQKPGLHAWIKMGGRNASRHTGRSLLTASLIASATFLIVALEAFRVDADPQHIHIKESGSGGFSLYAQSAASIPYDINSPEGFEALGIAQTSQKKLHDINIMPFRLRHGDESSCLNLYQPSQPRILGVTDAMIQRGGFVFSNSLAKSKEEKENPWTLLNQTFPDGAIPVIGDESAVLWQFHLGLGKDLVLTNERGQETTFRFVALLKGSLLQDELMISEKTFQHTFPSIEGYAFFLIDAPAEKLKSIEQLLESELGQFSFDVALSVDRLNDYLAVQNTYLSTFQTLGGLGLILGTIGLTAVLLRNVWERRSELALLRALGYHSTSLVWMVLVENAVMLMSGLLAGIMSAMLAIAPHWVSDFQTVPWPSLLLTLLLVFLTGMLAGGLAIIPMLRSPLLPALRSE